MDKTTQNKHEQYKTLVQKMIPNSPIFANCIKAFFVGGTICTLGELVSYCAKNFMNLPDDLAAAFTVIVMVFIGATLTGLGVYDKLSGFGGAGAAVPITGFANGIVASAMEYRTEGFIMGVGAKMFTIAGPVLVYGISTSALVGLVYHFFGL